MRGSFLVGLALALSACASSDNGGASNLLAETTWRLAELQSSDDTIGVVRPDDPSKYQMTLAADGAASFRLDCNRASGRWTATDPTLARGEVTFSPGAMTRAACLPGSLDTRVARELGYVRHYILEGERLTLTLMADGGSQVWTRAAGE